ncbi:unnamed protein product, partial [Polarella glacialis]
DKSSCCQERCVPDPGQLLMAHVIIFKQQDLELRKLEDLEQRAAKKVQLEAENDSSQPPRLELEKRRRQARQQLKYAQVREPLIRAALRGLECSLSGATGTVLLPGTSAEAEAVVSLYLLGGGAAKTPRPPGVDLREALGGVVVQRIENQPLFQQYMSLGQDSMSPGGKGRYREEVVWHGTRLKQVDQDASLADKLQSIAEKGFDPHRCIKGAAAEGGIWVATNPMESFGIGCDGLVAFILCLAKTNFNEWVDSSCARVLQRERVLPLYSLVHA